ncbi:hypothetical protein CL614_01625 [archaeon]|nr:hypothetical protein [archaeon]|tara:strand:+ start:97 stop:1647 length:1551 start_codon:yes stop_codon:yes gene_type:complete
MNSKFVEHDWIYPDVLEERDYQKAIAESALSGNTMCVLPTGMGKTPVAVMVAAFRLKQDMKKKILMVAPTKPLTAQHQRSFQKFLRVGEDELKVITGEIDPAKRIKQYAEADIVFSTPQTIQNDLKKGRLSLNDFSLLIVDECHRAVKKYAYTFIAKKYMEQAKDPLILGLTASPGGHMYKIKDVCKKLYVSNVEIRTRDDDDVKKYIQNVEQEKIEIPLTEDVVKIIKLLTSIKQQSLDTLQKWHVINQDNRMITKKYLIDLQIKLQKSSGGFKYMAMSKLAEIIKIDHALTLAETQTLHSLLEYLKGLKEQGESGDTKAATRLIKNPEFEQALDMTMELIKNKKEHPKLGKLREIVSKQLSEDKESRIIIFAQYRDTLGKIEEDLKNIEGVKSVMFIGQAMKKGRGLKQEEQIKILNEFKLGFHNVLLSSSVGEEGIDVTETNLVVFYEPVPSAIRSIQRRGRTGRTQAGRVVVLVTKDTRDEAYYWSAYHKEKKMHKTLDSMQNQSSLGGFAK